MYAHLRILGLKEALVEQAPFPPMTEEEESDPEKKKKRIEEEEERIKRSEKAMDIIFLNVGDKVLRKIDHCTTAAEAWSTLERLYLVKTLPNRVYLQLKVYNYRMQDLKSLDENIDEFLKMISDLNNLQIQVPDEVQAILILSSLPDRYEMLKETLKYGREGIRLEDVVSAAKSKELELRDTSDSKSVAEGLYVRGRSETRGGQSGNGNNNKSRSKSRDGKKICWICGKEGHYKKQCYKWIEKNKNKVQAQSSGESALAKDDAQDLVGLVASEVNLSEDQMDQNEWIMDTGCSFHMTPRKDIFIEFQEVDKGKVRMANNSSTEVKGIGKVRFVNTDGTTFVLHDVRYMPGMSRNLISMGTLEAKGCEFKAADGILKVIKGCTVFMKGVRKASLYVLQAEAKKSEAMVAESGNQDLDQTQVWHSRLGHVGQKGLDVLAKKGCFGKDKVSGLKFCEDCVFGKTHKVSFGPAQHVTKDKFDYVHSDLWGSPNVPHSLGKCQYFLSLTDDWSRKVWIYFLRSKDEAFEKFVQWKKMVEVQSERKVKRLRTDNGLEFCNHKFNDYCKQEGMVRHRTCTYTPQQNGVAERLNRTIMNKVRSMLSESGLGQKFWAEAASTSVYLINRSPSSAIDFQIPEERWTSAVPDLSGLRRFGCLVFAHSDEGKLNPRAKKGIFTGYPEGVKRFRVWLLDDQKCIISRNVVFRESVMYKEVIAQEQSGKSFNPVHLLTDDVTCEIAGKNRSTGDLAQGGVMDQDREASPGQSNVEGTTETETQSSEDHQIAIHRPRRQIIQPIRLQDYVTDEAELEEIAGYAYMVTEDGGKPEPGSFQEAMENPDKDKWILASDEEMDSLIKNKTWVLVERDKKQKPIGCKWVFKRKAGIAGVEGPRFKARLVAKGYSQKEGVDYQEIFSPVVKHVTIRFFLSMVAHFDMELQQMDVKTAFLHGYLDETIYMEQPEGYVDERYPDRVCLLQRSLYGLKQSPRQWNTRFNDFMESHKYERSLYDSCVYIKKLQNGEYIYLLLYVDDILIASKDKRSIEDLKALLGSEFEMKDLGEAKKILGMEIERDRSKGTLSISQEGYLLKLLGNFSMDQSKPVGTPIGVHFKLRAATDEEVRVQYESMRSIPYQSAVGSLMYSMIGTRPDLAHSVSLVCRFMSKPLKQHWQAVKWILRYIKGSLKRKLCYSSEGDFVIQGYCDSDYGADKDRRRSTSGVVFTVGGNVVSWKSSLQKVVALSSTEAEYMALTDASKEAVWLLGLMNELGFKQKTVDIYSDSQSAIALAKNAVFHERTKHIEVKYHFIRDLISDGVIQVKKIATSYNPADIFTKVVPVGILQEALEFLRVTEN
ncbi:Zinc finger CCHC-type superfamily [Arabidopsis thaliana x Arabidopsis arenosa]|uniref:Zinc finger CCHC-type superfamily n=1 Tax=Arabidopsis thaliana x Arabidopsis arenosa TaxID=1240361 RepID=A0A8T1XE97_9BRAS|nr:Zinc finger CCHC-type superfamily [Arabidopsis thaliana x Arabidopsis arenosa]